MLEYIEFKDKRFDRTDENNVIQFTNNTIILCNNYDLMDSLEKEIINTVNGKAEYNDYWYMDEDAGCAKSILSFGLQRLIDINGQRITLSLEPAIIYKAEGLDDIWLFDCCLQETNSGKIYQEFIYPAYSFIGSADSWEEGKDKIYKEIVSGEYGTYDGDWVKKGE